SVSRRGAAPTPRSSSPITRALSPATSASASWVNPARCRWLRRRAPKDDAPPDDGPIWRLLVVASDPGRVVRGREHTTAPSAVRWPIPCAQRPTAPESGVEPWPCCLVGSSGGSSLVSSADGGTDPPAQRGGPRVMGTLGDALRVLLHESVAQDEGLQG